MYRGGIVDLRGHFEAEGAARNVSAEMELQRLEAEKLATAAREQAEQLAADRRISVRTLFDRWASVELKSHIRTDGKTEGRKDGGAYALDQFKRRVFPKLGDVAAADVKKSDLLAILDAVKAEGKLRTCNVLLANLKQMFRFALAREIVERHPLDTVTKRDAGGAEVERERVLTADELKALASKLPGAGMSERSSLAVWAVLATCCRVGELMGAEWQHVDLVAKRWYLPKTKNGRDHTIHLSAFAVERFKALEALRGKDKNGQPLPWVFSNTAGTGPVDAKTFTKQLSDRQREPERRLTNRAKATTALTLPGGRWTPHDLRRTGATLMAQLGVSGDVIDEALNHVIASRVRRVYIRDRRPAEQARAFDALGARLAGIVGGAPSNVLPFPKAA